MGAEHVALVQAVEQLTLEYSGLVPPGVIARCVRRCHDRLVEAGVAADALPAALFAMARAMVEAERPARGTPPPVIV